VLDSTLAPPDKPKPYSRCPARPQRTVEEFLAKSFNVPQQLGDGAVKIHPSYFQIYAGLGLNFHGWRV
jgi:hypothetical protein